MRLQRGAIPADPHLPIPDMGVESSGGIIGCELGTLEITPLSPVFLTVGPRSGRGELQSIAAGILLSQWNP